VPPLSEDANLESLFEDAAPDRSADAGMYRPIGRAEVADTQLLPPPPVVELQQVEVGLAPELQGMHSKRPGQDASMPFSALCSLPGLSTSSAPVTAPLIQQFKVSWAGSWERPGTHHMQPNEVWRDAIGLMHGLDGPLAVGTATEDTWLQDQQQRRHCVFHCGEVLKALRSSSWPRAMLTR
jgi:hypothetical protein